MNLGFTYDEKIFTKDNRDMILKAKKLGLKSLELIPDKKIMTEEEFVSLAKFAAENGININFHVPNFISDLYDPKSMIYREDAVFKKFEEMFSIIETVLKYTSADENNDQPSVLVLHGEDFLLTEEKDFTRTKKIVEYCLSKLQERNLNLKVALETLRFDTKKRIGDNHQDLLQIIESVDSSIYDTERLGICLDICHDSMNKFPYKSMFTDKFIEKIVYIHAHGIDLSNNNAHISLVKSSVNFLDTILFLKENTDNLTINLELLSEHVGKTYLSDLFFDLHILNNLV